MAGFVLAAFIEHDSTIVSDLLPDSSLSLAIMAIGYHLASVGIVVFFVVSDMALVNIYFTALSSMNFRVSIVLSISALSTIILLLIVEAVGS